jgi:membrane carboxypeptidase/penicillin-binding protein
MTNLVLPDAVALDKADLVLASLRSAGLKVPFGMDVDEAAEMWAMALGAYSVDVLTATTGKWIMTNETFPTLAEFLDQVKRLNAQMVSDQRQEQVTRICPECDGLRYVRVQRARCAGRWRFVTT